VAEEHRQGPLVPAARDPIETIQRAIEELNKEPKVQTLFVFLPKISDPEDLRLFPQFVDALEGHASLTSLHLSGVRGDAGAPRSGDLARLFRAVLPNLPLLKYISFSSCVLSPLCVMSFFSALPVDRRPLLHVRFEHTSLPHESCRAIAEAVRRGVLVDLALYKTPMDSPSGGLVLQSALQSPRLRAIAIMITGSPPYYWDWTVTEATRGGDGTVGRAERLRSLAVHADWTDRGLAELVRQLRVNESLERLAILGGVHDNRRLCSLLVELLSTYNFSITTVRENTLGDDQRNLRRSIDALLLRNGRVRQVNARLRRQGYRIADPRLWPTAVEAIGAFPTLVYRFLRLGSNVADILSEPPRSRSRSPTGDRDGGSSQPRETSCGKDPACGGPLAPKRRREGPAP
jgi:hypothetical protein